MQMRGFFSFLILFGQVAGANNAALQKCFPTTNFSKSQVKCVLSQSEGDLKFTLSAGTSLKMVGVSKFGEINKSFAIERITLLQPRLTEAGPIDESLRFLGTSATGNYIATIAFACNETVFALVGFDKTQTDKELPKDHVASCQLQPLK
jgi:hypothetical protein